MKQRFVVRSEEEANCYQLASVLEAEACLGGTTESLPHFHKKGVKKKMGGAALRRFIAFNSAVEQGKLFK